MKPTSSARIELKPASGPNAPPVSHCAPLTLSTSTVRTGIETPLTGKPKTGPSKIFHAACAPNANQSDLVTSRLAHAHKAKTTKPQTVRAVCSCECGLPKCTAAKASDVTAMAGTTP